MKKTSNYFYALVAALVILSGTSYASFPVKNNNKSTQVAEQKSTTITVTSVELKKEIKISKPAKKSNSIFKSISDEKLITLLLWLFLGFLAGHRWYRGKPLIWNILYIITGGGFLIWAFVDLFNILTDNF